MRGQSLCFYLVTARPLVSDPDLAVVGRTVLSAPPRFRGVRVADGGVRTPRPTTGFGYRAECAQIVSGKSHVGERCNTKHPLQRSRFLFASLQKTAVSFVEQFA